MTFRRSGLIDPLSMDDYMKHGGLAGLRKALEITPVEIVAKVVASGLRGRGGAAFPTGIKWETAMKASSPIKYVVCNADEGDSGSFSDRMLMEGDPFTLIEGMAIASLAIGAAEGYVYLRSEYPYTKETFSKAIKEAYEKGLLGDSILGSKKRFDLYLVIGGGSYVCGEETALLESLENRRGMVRPRPPVPAVSGLFGRPTILNNVITFASVVSIFEKGAEHYKKFGVGKSVGTLPFQLSGNIKRPGLVEAPLGIGLKELIYGFGGGTASGRPVKAVQIGGPLGAYFPAPEIEKMKLTYEDVAANGGILGHGGIVVFDDEANMADQAMRSLEFVVKESCGKCTPCRLGSMRAYELLEAILKGSGASKDLGLLKDVFVASANLSLCGLGGMMNLPVESLLRNFPGEFGIKGTYGK
jgi:formate dehydrogenase iron-sulfur subunit